MRSYNFQHTPRVNLHSLKSLLVGLFALSALFAGDAALAQSASDAGADSVQSGPVRLRQPTQMEQKGVQTPASKSEAAAPVSPVTPPFSEFEQLVRMQPGAQDLRRLGQTLIEGLQPSGAPNDHSVLVPPDYILRPGDELLVTLWGSIDADLRLVVDRSGRITIPRVGPVMVSGVRYGDVTDVISRRVATVFKSFQLSASLGQLRGIRVYVTGFVNKPGSVTVSSLATLVQALIQAGGPSSAGSYRDIQLRRGRSVVANFDLYELLLKGDRGADQWLQADDVVHVGPTGPQIALIGSVNRPAIFEIKPSETIEDVLRMAGGFNAVADNRRLTLERFAAIGDRLRQIDLPANHSMPLRDGDVLRAFNASDIARPLGQSSKRIRVEGEVTRPGEYVLPPDSTLADALKAAGGLSENAYLYAAEFTRESVRQVQQRNYDRALRDFDAQITTAAATRRASSSEEVAAAASAAAQNTRLVEQLRGLRPTGRIVLQLTPTSDRLPDLVLEDGDRLSIPARTITVGVFGSVFSPGSYLYADSRTVGNYLRLAGGPTRGADDGAVFVVRANGSVNGSLQNSNFFSRGNQIADLAVEPGDTIFVPEEMNKTTWVQSAKDWTQILYQFGLGIAGLKSALQ